MVKWLRFLIFALLVVLLIVGGIYYYRNFYTKKEIIVSEIYRYIPTDATLILESKNIRNLKQRLSNSCKPWSLLLNITELEKINKAVIYLDSIYTHHPLLKNLPQKGPILISFHPYGKTGFHELYILNVSTVSSSSALKSLVQDIYQHQVEMEEKTYNHQTIFIVKTSSTNFYHSFNGAFLDGWLFISPSSLLIESVIRQYSSKYSLFDDPSFARMIKTSGQNVEMNVFANHRYFWRIWSEWLSNDMRKKINPKQSFAEWSAMDWHISQNMLLLNGFIDQGDSLTNYLKILTTQEPVTISITSILPKETYLFYYTSMPNFSKWQEDYDKHLESYGLSNNRLQVLSSIKKQTSISLVKLFENIIYKECAFANVINTETKDSTDSDDQFWIVRIANQSTIKELLDSTLSKYIRQNKKSWNEITADIKLDADYTFTVYNFPIINAPEILFGKLFRTYTSRYFIYLDNYIVFSSTKEALKRFYYAYMLKKTLQNDKLYRSYTEMVDLQTNLMVYLDLSKSQNFLKNLFQKKIETTLFQNYDVLRQLDAISFQLTYTNKMFYSSLFIRYSPEIKENTYTVWESKLDTISIMKPVFVLNHHTQDKEIIVQDLYNNLYLINSSGRILWKNHLPEQIRSDVYQIDIYNNKKLQYLFSTRNYIYVVDRNGEMVHPFPVKLKAPATNGISIVDWNGKNDLRILVACQDKNVYSYALNGMPDKNWKFEKTNQYVYQPIQFAKTEKKEYVFFADSLNIYILNKQGKPYFSLKQNIVVNPKSIIYFEPKNKDTDARFIVNDIYGNIHFIGTDGQIRTSKFINSEKAHYFLYNDMDGDGLSEFIFVDQKYLTIYKRNKKILLSHKISCLPQFRPVYYEFPLAKHKIGFVCNSQLYLIDKDGNMPNGFPIKGISPFSISHLQKPVRTYFLITCNDQGYLTNYEVFR